MESVSQYVAPSHGQHKRHIRKSGLEQLNSLTTGNGKFQQLAVSHKSRGTYQKETAIVDPKKYFHVDPKDHLSWTNKFRTESNEKYRLGTTHSELCSSIKGKCAHPEQQDMDVEGIKHRGINRCRDAVKSMVENQDHQMRPKKGSHMREMLLTETLARQLNEIDNISDRERAGEEIKKTLDWIDSMLVSEELNGINVGGQLKDEHKQHKENLKTQTKNLAHTAPLIKIDSQSPVKSKPQGTGFPTLNETLVKVREELIQTELEMAIDSCATEANLKWAGIHGGIMEMDSQINQLNSGTLKGLTIVPESNLAKTKDAVGHKCEQYKENFNEGIEPITKAMTDQANWTKGVKGAVEELKTLSSGLASNCGSTSGRAEWTQALKEWHTKHKDLLLPNSSGKLSKAQEQLGTLVSGLEDIVEEEATKKSSMGLNPRIDKWADKALEALELSSDILLSAETSEHEPLKVDSKLEETQSRLTQISQKTVEGNGSTFGSKEKFLPKHKSEYNEKLELLNANVQEKLNVRVLKLNQKIEGQAKTTLATMVNIGLRGHNDYISHLKKHIDDDGCKHLAEGGYEKLSSSVETAKKLAQQTASYHPDTDVGEELSETITKMDTQVVETLKQQKEFVGKSLFSTHREKLMSSFSPHMQKYAYFDHPPYDTIKTNMQKVVKDPNFQKKVAEDMEVHGQDISQLVGSGSQSELIQEQEGV
ncbi:hypothetical protein M9194_20485 [Vibrio sp. S4M6]|uniref:hypothetical protein n=1 Tax=Vibrio sinus TaxID=2946865 RepID=UPI002029C978|nr:hypothetical protein [Vibrio sinus]MCL9783807.1 hypothetical protein [Vibrio sinus]